MMNQTQLILTNLIILSKININTLDLFENQNFENNFIEIKPKKKKERINF